MERQTYKCLGSYTNVAEYICSTANGSTVLKRGQALRGVCQQTQTRHPYDGSFTG